MAAKDFAAIFFYGVEFNKGLFAGEKHRSFLN